MELPPAYYLIYWTDGIKSGVCEGSELLELATPQGVVGSVREGNENLRSPSSYRAAFSVGTTIDSSYAEL